MNQMMKFWPQEDQPRERLIKHGSQQLKAEELLAILIGNGNSELNALQIAEALWNGMNRSYKSLMLKANLFELTKYNGIGQAKAVSIISALELGRRISQDDLPKQYNIHSAEQAYHYIKYDLMFLPHEEFWVIFLNRGNKVIHKECLSKGGLTGTIADRRLMYKKAIQLSASAIIVAHNHPSGNPKPSEADIKLTKLIAESGRLLDIPLLDHLIITINEFTSFQELGKMP